MLSRTLAQSAILGTLLLTGLGCSSSQNEPADSPVIAVVDGVEIRNGDFLFPVGTARANTVTYLKLDRRPHRENSDNSLELIFSGLPYLPSVYGEIGDTVEFGYDEKIPLSGELQIEHVKCLRVKRRPRPA
jgi:hypothetical protein